MEKTLSVAFTERCFSALPLILLVGVELARDLPLLTLLAFGCLSLMFPNGLDLCGTESGVTMADDWLTEEGFLVVAFGLIVLDDLPLAVTAETMVGFIGCVI